MLITPRPEPVPDDESRPSIGWEEAGCPLCASRHWSPLIEAQDPQAGVDGLWFAVVQCDACGTCFTNPRPDAASIGRFYPKNYAPHERHIRPRSASFWRGLKNLWSPPRVEMRPVAWHGEGRLLDFGCGNGAYLKLMADRGWKVTGLDFSSRAVEQIREQLGLTAYLGTLPHIDLEHESFDVITMWHSLEHVHEPMSLLRESRKLLVPGGKIVIAVPNIDSWPFRWFGRHWFGLDVPRHLTHFTPTSLTQMLQRAGFATAPLEFARYSYWIRESARRYCSHHIQAPWTSRAMRNRYLSRIASWWCWLHEQSDCIVATGRR